MPVLTGISIHDAGNDGSVSKVDYLNLGLEQVDECADLVKKLRESHDHRLSLPLTKLPERYLRGDFCMVFKCSTQEGVFGHRKFSLSVQSSLSCNLLHVGRELDKGAGIDDDKLPVLIESIHVVDDEERIIRDIGPSIVRLHLLDPVPHLSVSDSLYFSFVSLNSVFVGGIGLHVKDRKLDNILGLAPRFIGGEVREVPDNMVKAGSQVVNDLSREDTETYRNALVAVIVDRFLPHLVIWMGEDWVVPATNELGDFGFKVDDVLIGPL